MNPMKMASISMLLLLSIGTLHSQPFISKDTKLPNSQSPPCQFNWNNVLTTEGEALDFIEDKGCQPGQGPCVAFSFVKAMEANLNIEHNQSCQEFNFSIPYLDFAGWTPNGIINILNDGFQIPENETILSNGTTQLCGNFAYPTCDDPDDIYNDYCFCQDNVIQDGPIANDLCYQIIFVNPAPDDPHDDCEDYWSLFSFPMTRHKMYTNGISFVNNSMSSIDDVKNKILNEGPLVAIINEPLILDDLRGYDNLDNVAFHSFVISGWKETDDPEVTTWFVDDHWPGNGGFCGEGETNPIVNSTFLSYLTNSVASGKWLSLYSVGDVDITNTLGSGAPACQNDGGYTVNLNAQNIACEEEPPVECPLPVITGIVQAGGGDGCLRRNRSNYLTATVECTVPAVDYEWVVLPGGAGQHSSFPCNSHVSVIPSTTAEVVFIKVRARGECENVWTDWFFKEFCLIGGDGGPDSPDIYKYK